MSCSYVVPNGKYKGFKCSEDITIGDMCDRCHQLTEIDKQYGSILCLYSVGLKGFLCQFLFD